jgi:tRNA threonylcarbamoyladenosine biosynthesis protein TsaE
MKLYISSTPKKTQEIAAKLVESLETPFLLALEGNLGAGKTVFVKGLAKGLDVKKAITSPTFNILKLYKTGNKKIKYLCHVDAYRLKSESELEALGINEYIEDKDTLVIIEWSNKIKNILPSNYFLVSLTAKTEKKREIKIERINKD